MGRKGPEVSRIGFGAWAIGGVNWGPTDDGESKRALRRAIELGVTLIDTADVYGYGHSEELIAEVLSEVRNHDVVVATKAGNDFYNATPADDTGYGPIRLNGGRAYLISAAEKSLRRLGRDCLDILQLHSLDTSQLESEEPWEALYQLKKQGKIRYSGWSVKSFKETAHLKYLERHHDVLDCLQVRYNLLERNAEDELFPAAQRFGLGIIVRIPLLFGLLTGKFSSKSRFDGDDHRSFNLAPEKLSGYLGRLQSFEDLYSAFPGQSKAQVSLRFALTHPACHTVIPGGRTVAQVEDNCLVGDLGALPPGLVG